MKRFTSLVLTTLIIIILIGGALISALPEEQADFPKKVEDLLPTPMQTPVVKQNQGSINQLRLEDKMIYPPLEQTNVITAYITVRRGNVSDNTDNSWADVNNASKAIYDSNKTVEVPKAEVIFQIGNEIGPLPGEFGFNETQTNGTIQIRGNSSSKRQVKSYKVELRNWSGGWNDQYTLALNKHVADPTKIKNKLSYDLLIGTSDIVSLRTQFFHIYIKDETVPEGNGRAFVDYGLFTAVEQPNKTFLRNHGLDPNAQLYKANFFEFFRYPEIIKLVDDPTYDSQKFESILEVKGDQNHTKLIEMLQAVNDPLIPITDTFEYYFDADNYFTWMAFNILVGNVDTSSQNFYLYSPQASHKWFFIPWDYDGSFNKLNLEEFGRIPAQTWQEGLQTYWGSVLHRRVLSEPIYREKLKEKIEYWRSVLTVEKINSHLNIYRPLTEPILNSLPDQLLLKSDEYKAVYASFNQEIENNFKLYQNTLEEPMPFFIADITFANGKTNIIWTSSYDFKDTDIEYHLQISKDLDFVNNIVDEKVINFTSFELDQELPIGVYFIRILASDPDGNQQSAYGRYVDINKTVHVGVTMIAVTGSNDFKRATLING